MGQQGSLQNETTAQRRALSENGKTLEHRLYRCDKCTHVTKRKFNLQRHLIMMHGSTRDQKCSICGKGYKSGNYLAIHMRKHSDQFKYICPVCSEGFFKKSHLKKHVVCHMTTNVYKCKHCDEQFSCYRDLRKHIKSKHKDLDLVYTCLVCANAFASDDDLKSHIQSDHQMACTVCGKTYNYHSSLLYHTWSAHGF